MDDERVEEIKREIEGWSIDELQELGSFIESIITAREENGEDIYGHTED